MKVSRYKISGKEKTNMEKRGRAMRSKLRLLSLVGGLALVAVACTAPSPPSAINEPSAANESTDTPEATQADAQTPIESAERIVALTSLSADLVVALAPDRLVGSPDSSLINQDPRFADIETVSEGRTEPNLEKIVALSPDLVIGAQGIQDKTLQRMEDLGVETLTVDIDSWEGLKAFTTVIATVVEANPQPLLDRYDACLADIPAEQPSALVLVSRQPLLTPNKESWAGDFLEKMNIQNIAADFQGESSFGGYVTLSAEKVIETDPDGLIVVDTREDLLTQLKGEPFWSQLKATQTDKVLATDYFGLVNPGSLSSIETACEQLKQFR